MQTKLGQTLAADWRRNPSNADIYFSIHTVNDDFVDEIGTIEFPREDWMLLPVLSSNQVAEENSLIDEQYWSQCHDKFSEDKKIECLYS